MANKEMSWNAEVSLFFVSEMVGEYLEFKLRREHPMNDYPFVILKDIKCKYKPADCEVLENHYKKMLSETLFVLPNNQNHWGLPSALRQFTGLMGFLNDLIKSGYVDQLNHWVTG